MKKRKMILLSLGILVSMVLLSNITVKKSSQMKTFDSVQNIPHNKVGLVLGTGKYTNDNRINLFYQYRIDATVKLYKEQKIDYVLISADNGSKNYDEPSTFKIDLIKQGIPTEKIFLDYAGFRTLDSVVRANKIFGLNDVTIISQKFHNERAIFLANHYDVNAIGFNAQDVPNSIGLLTHLREYLARTKAVLDIITDKSPRYLGEPIAIH
ncbi:vancomycin high temperature exclusion protein [Mangrovimonas sp. CR14]|nr:vancomycin high temperature exclusion protein [Mangrovimonas sp. CR14]